MEKFKHIQKNGDEHSGPYILIYTHNPASTSIDSWPNLFHYTLTDLPKPHFSMDFFEANSCHDIVGREALLWASYVPMDQDAKALTAFTRPISQG